MGDVRGGQDVEIGGIASGPFPPSATLSGNRVGQRYGLYGDAYIGIADPDSLFQSRVGLYGSLETGERNLVWSDFLGDSVEATKWTTTNANGGTSTSSNGECVLATSANANGSTILVAVEKVRYLPGVMYAFGARLRLADAGLALNSRRFGLFTLSGTTPQDGYYFELSGTTLNAVSCKAGSATATAVASWSRQAQQSFTLDANYHRWEIAFAGDYVLFIIDGVIRHVLLDNNISTPRTVTKILPVCLQNSNIASAATNEQMMCSEVWVAKLGDMRDEDIPHALQNKVAQYTTTQTGVALWTPPTGKRIVVTTMQIQAGGTVAGAVQVWFGQSADTTYTRGTDLAIFDGEFAPSTTLKPGVVQTAAIHGWKGNVDDILRVTDSAAINPLTVNVWGYEE